MKEEGGSFGQEEAQAKQRSSSKHESFCKVLVQFDVNNHGSGASIYEVYDRASHELCSRDVGVDRVPRFDSKTISCLLPRGRHPCLSHSLNSSCPFNRRRPVKANAAKAKTKSTRRTMHRRSPRKAAAVAARGMQGKGWGHQHQHHHPRRHRLLQQGQRGRRKGRRT